MQANLFLLTGVLVLSFAQASRADDRIAVVTPAILDPNAPISQAMKRECSLEANLGSQVFQKVSERFPGTEQIQNSSQAGPEKIVLRVTILGALGMGGGGWSGPKAMNVRAEILRNAKVIEATTLNRQSRPVWGSVSGTCPIMHRIAAALGQDVARWLPSALMLARNKSSSSDRTVAPARRKMKRVRRPRTSARAKPVDSGRP